MKLFLSCFSLFVSLSFLQAQNGQLSADLKSFVGQKITCGQLDQVLKGYTFDQFVELEKFNGKYYYLSVYSKKTTRLVLLHTDDEKKGCYIQDLVQLININSQTNVQMGSCRIGSKNDSKVIATEKNGKYLQAFRANLEKGTITKISSRNIDCMVEGI
jgi:hypothetical protein